jgi:hypothetical protein
MPVFPIGFSGIRRLPPSIRTTSFAGCHDNRMDKMQVVNQLIKHNKDFDLLVVPGMDHGSGGAYGDHKRYDFFVRHLLGIHPPSWAAVEDALKPQSKSTSATNGR